MDVYDTFPKFGWCNPFFIQFTFMVPTFSVWVNVGYNVWKTMKLISLPRFLYYIPPPPTPPPLPPVSQYIIGLYLLYHVR